MAKINISNIDGLQIYNAAQLMLDAIAAIGRNEAKRAIAAGLGWEAFALQFGIVGAPQSDVELVRDIWLKINNGTATLSEIKQFCGSISATVS